MPDATSPLGSMNELELIRIIAARRRSQSEHRGWRCPSAEQMAAYLERRLTAKDKTRLEAHLSHCDFCIGLISSVVRQLEKEKEVEVPPLLLRQAITLVPEKTPARRSRPWVLATPALAAIVVASAVLLKQPQSSQIRHAELPPPAIFKTSTISAPMAKSELTPAGKRQVRGLKTQTANLQLLEPRSGSILRSSELRFRWNPVSKAIYYEIHVVNSEGDPVWRTESTEPAAQTPGNLSLVPGKYFVWVSVQLNDGRTLKSETTSFVIASSS